MQEMIMVIWLLRRLVRLDGTLQQPIFPAQEGDDGGAACVAEGLLAEKRVCFGECAVKNFWH